MRAVVLVAFCALLSFFVSCRTVAPPREGPVPPESSAAPAVAEPSPAVPKKATSPAEEILLRDPATGKVRTLAEMADGRPVLLDLSASWCEPCAELTGRLNAVLPRFAGRIDFFMLIQKNDAVERFTVPPGYPVYQLEEAPVRLGIAPPSILPTVLIVTADGTIAATLEGLYPALVYYGTIADVLSGG